MARADVWDVLAAVAAADRRTVGNADVTVWEAVIGNLPKELCLAAVRDHLRCCPGVWLEPGHVYQRVRAMQRDLLERESDEAREARQQALEAKAAADPVEPAASNAPPKYRRPQLNALSVPCPYEGCKAGVGRWCTNRATGRPRKVAHPARLDAAEATL